MSAPVTFHLDNGDRLTLDIDGVTFGSLVRFFLGHKVVKVTTETDTAP